MDSAARIRTMKIAVIALLVLWVADRTILSPLTASVSTYGERRRTLQAEVAKAEALHRQCGELSAELRSMRSHFLPDDASDAEAIIVRQLRAWADEAGLALESMRPAHHTGEKTASRLNVQIGAQGSLAANGRFLYAIETSTMPLRVVSMELASATGGGDQLRLSLEIDALLTGGADKASGDTL